MQTPALTKLAYFPTSSWKVSCESTRAGYGRMGKDSLRWKYNKPLVVTVKSYIEVASPRSFQASK